jgi:hypothetical protein
MKQLKTWAYVFKRSVTDPLYYNDILKTDFWFSLRYLFVLLFFIALILTVKFAISVASVLPKVDTFTQKGVVILREAYPDDLSLTIMNGKLYTNVEEPYYIDSLPEIGNVMKDTVYDHFITIDTQGILDEYIQYKTLILVTQDGVIYPSRSRSKSYTQPQVFFFSQIKQNGTLNKRAYNEIVNRVEPYVRYIKPALIVTLFIGIILLPFLISSFLVLGKLIQLLLLTIIIFVIARLMKVGLRYSQLYRLGIHGLTASIVAVAVMDGFAIQHRYIYTALFFLFMVVVLSKIEKSTIMTIQS